MSKRDNKKILEEKLAKLKELALTIELYGTKTITMSQKSLEHNEQEKLEFNLNELVIESKIAEAEIKIKAFQKIIDIIK